MGQKQFPILLRGQTSEKNLWMQEIMVEFVYSRQQKIKDFLLKDDNGKLWVEVMIVSFFCKQKWL